MGIVSKVKKSILSQSDEYNFLKKENKKLKKSSQKLKKEKSLLKNNQNKQENLIKYLLEIEEYNEDTLNYCPACDSVVKFKPFGNPPRENAQCPNCKSLERDRFSNIIINKRFGDLFKKPSKVLHFAPERILYNTFKNSDNIDYYPVDFDVERYEKKNMPLKKQINMENITFEDNTFDFIYNFHVLEHVPDDIKAMSELHRVLKDDGVCFVAVPLFNIPETYQNDEYNTPELRLKHYGQEDHLRMYGHDFKDKLESVGFKVEAVQPKDLFENERIRTVLGLMDSEKIFLCSKQFI